MGVNHVDIGGVIAEGIAGRRNAADQDRLLPTDRWLGTLSVAGHGEGDGVSWVTLTDPYGMRWGYLWPWRDHDVQEKDMPSDAVEDLDEDLLTGEFSAADANGVRWLLSGPWVERHHPELLPPATDTGAHQGGGGFRPDAVRGQWVDVSGAVAAWQARLRAADPATLQRFERWVAAMALEGHGEQEGVSWVGFTWAPGPSLGWRWAWAQRRSPGEDLLSVVIDDLAEDLAHGGITAPEGEDGIRWLLSGPESIRPPLVPREI